MAVRWGVYSQIKWISEYGQPLILTMLHEHVTIPVNEYGFTVNFTIERLIKDLSYLTFLYLTQPVLQNAFLAG